MQPESLKKNVLANYLCQGWIARLAFMPMYHYIGVGAGMN
jgi:hypothetical protein